MKTLFKKIGGDECENNRVITQAGEIIKSGGIVAFPTETVYGLGANGLMPEAAAKIYAAKGRPSDNPLILHISKLNDIYSVADNISPAALRLMKKFWPGPLTIILPKLNIVPDTVTGGLNTVAVRLPDSDIAIGIINAAGVPVAAPSANISGRPSPTSANHVMADMDGKIDMVVDGGECFYGLESTIVDASAPRLRLLRPGAITFEMLMETIVDIEIATEISDKNAPPPAPGMKYTHYSPKAAMYLVTGQPDKVACKIKELVKNSPYTTGILGTDETLELYDGLSNVYSLGKRDKPWEIGRNLFDILRSFDNTDIALIYSETIEPKGIGLAVMNRLTKAAGHRVIDAD